MSTIDRRAFMGGLGLAGMAGMLAACGGESAPPNASGGGGGGADGTLRWWDHLGGLQDLHDQWAADEGERLGVTIEHTYNEPGKATEALQLANQSDQLPDVYTPLVGLPMPALVDAGWIHEITLSDEAIARLPEGSFVEGLTMLDGKIYGLPAFTDKQYAACTWYNSAIAEEVGFEPPTSYDEFLAVLQAIADHGAYAPMTMALGATGRMREQIDDLAQAGGFPGYQGLRYDTGEYEYHHDAYVAAIELYKEISDRGFLLPGTNNFQIPDARGRWAAGEIAFHMDGPYSPGAVRSLNPDALEFMAVAGMLTPEGDEVVATRGARGADWVVGGTTQVAEYASQLIETFTQEDYQTALASGMDQPPIVLDTVAGADVIEPYAWLVEEFRTRIFRGPQPIVRNVDVATVQANQSPVAPELGNVIQGYLGGEISDLRAALVDLSDANSAALDDAIATAVDDGAEVSRADWEFPDWVRGQDYTY
ncbi:extracellular solute-binding protein family 1 [Beutenbergia cavernae DSM 12333]|uniref:Extracellular solute-binding protein family 1 n=1 Tax=Beutenbergia cavernae (strain ATCC BAA-8 / DSM 12333 / CCUG 43141 / JCM 11478 / NBRC 16432 / NCIMB 13614 / HKI 0122) TaxID=471853 RepID=C5C3A0_BEUC1|nr:ABC transporter substrate-binding protein [Beutenbergia cavernae]ACQ79799.1 extracellular solute-binding protein family 1 [Beutenbergia cavernae DSM 12333]